MRKFFSITVLVSFSICVSAQNNNFTISGNVSDVITNEGLIGVNIISNKTGTSTDINGNYTLNLPYGEHNIVYKYIGYEEVKKQIKVFSDSVLNINVKLGQ